jgi:hypothetical protein
LTTSTQAWTAACGGVPRSSRSNAPASSARRTRSGSRSGAARRGASAASSALRWRSDAVRDVGHEGAHLALGEAREGGVEGGRQVPAADEHLGQHAQHGLASGVVGLRVAAPAGRRAGLSGGSA